MTASTANPIRIGWAQADMTPTEPVLLAGQFHARVSEGVLDPLSATVLVLDAADDQCVFVSCDLVSIPHALRDAVRRRLNGPTPGLDPRKVVLHATHTHAAPEVGEPVLNGGARPGWPGIDLPVMPIAACVDFIADRLAAAVIAAWQARAPGQIAWGQGAAVVGHNRRWVNRAGAGIMYGNTSTPEFHHIEGGEDHTLNLLATRDMQGNLTGLLVNLACPSQESEHLFELSADFWCETRAELRRRFGSAIFILPQCSAAGELTSHLIYEKQAAERMLRLKNRTPRQDIANRIADGVQETLAWLQPTGETAPSFEHRILDLHLPLTRLTAADAAQADAEAEKHRLAYETEKARLAANPALRQEPRWYVKITHEFRRMNWFAGVSARFKQGPDAKQAVEIHVVRLDDLVFATNPFEYYLDFGIAIKARSKAVQTFIVQLAGPGTYVPSARSVAGGGYGSTPASNPVGPQGGQQLAESTLAEIEILWQAHSNTPAPTH